VGRHGVAVRDAPSVTGPDADRPTVGANRLRAAARARAVVGWLVLVVAGALALSWSPLLNGFPLVYHDTGTYLLSSFTLRVPADRPIGYSLFVRLTRLQPSLWPVVAAQALATSYLVLRATVLLLPGLPGVRLVALGVLLALAAATSLSGFVGYVMPDVFAGWIFLGMVLCVLGRGWVDRVAGASAVVLAVLVHNGNGVLAVAAAAVLLAACWLLPGARPQRRPAAQLVALAVLAVPAVGAVHWAFGAGFAISRGAPTHLVNKLVDTGVIDGALALHCPDRGWVLCRHRELLARHRGEGFWFLWAPDSPIAELGWEQGGGEQTEVVVAALRCCFDALLRATAAGVWSNLTEVNGGPALPVFADADAPPRILRQYYLADVPAFLAGAQQSGRSVPTVLLPLTGIGAQPAIALGVAALGVVLWLTGHRRPAVAALAAVAFVLLNSVVVGLLNQHEDRLLSRVSWLLPYGALVALAAARVARGGRPGRPSGLP
jgi:hypothetical protein